MKVLLCILMFVAGCAGAEYYSLSKCQALCQEFGYEQAEYVSIDNAEPCDKCSCIGKDKAPLTTVDRIKK